MNDLHKIPATDLFLALKSHPDLAGARSSALSLIVLQLASKTFDITPEELLGRSRQPRISRARQIAMCSLYELGHSLDAVGEFFGGRHHGTVIHARKVSRHLCDQDPDFASLVHAFRAALALPPQPPRISYQTSVKSPDLT